MADDEGKDDTGQDDDDQDDWTPPSKEEWERTTEALSKGNNEAKKWRLRAQGKDDKWSVPGWQKPDEDEGADDEGGKKPAPPKVNAEQVRREAEEETRAKIKPGLVAAAARDALRDAGLVVPAGKDKSDQAFKRALRLIDLGEIEVDEDGSVSGVDDQVRAVKRDYPELFAKKGGKAVDAGAGSNGDPGTKTTTSANRIAALITGQSG